MDEGFKETKLSEKITLMEVPNKERRIYNIKTKISDQLIIDIKYMDDSSMRLARPLNKASRKLIKAILGIKGVCEISVDKYELTVEKGLAFGWDADAIQYKIISCIEAFQK